MRWLALAAAALPLTACGSSNSTTTPVTRAAGKAVGAGSEHVTFHGTVVGSGAADTVLSGAGDFQNQPKVGGAHLAAVAGDTRRGFDEVLDGSKLYLRSPLFSKVMPKGRSWLYLDLEKASGLGVNFSAFAQASPADTLEALRKAKSVTTVGVEMLGGLSTTHYRAVVDSNAVATPVDVWVDSGDQLRRLRFGYSTNASGSQLHGTITMDFAKFGEKVFVKVPSADETLDMTKLGG